MSPCNARVGRGGESSSLGLVLEEPFSPVHHFRNGPEIDHRLAISAKKLPMFLRIFCQHAAAHCSRFEGSHDVTITIGSAYQAKRNFGRGRCHSQNFNPGVPTKRASRFSMTIPIVAI